jgi:hypothetical protein
MFGTPVSNDTIICNVNQYLRQNPDTNSWELNLRVDPTVETDTWTPIGPHIHALLANDAPGTSMPTIGKIIHQLVAATRNEIAWRERYDTIHKQARETVQIIGDRLIQESNDRNWCSEFDQIIEEVNSSIPGPFYLPTREREYEVRWTETYYVTVNRSYTTTARNEEDAIDNAKAYAEDGADEYDLREAISIGNYEFSDDCDDYEVEEV